MTYFLLLKFAILLQDSAASGDVTAPTDAIMALTEDEVTELREQHRRLGKEVERLLGWRKWKEENRQPELVLKNG